MSALEVLFLSKEDTAMTWMRTGAVTAMGAKHLARKDSKVRGHIGTRGTSWYNVAMMDHIFRTYVSPRDE